VAIGISSNTKTNVQFGRMILQIRAHEIWIDGMSDVRREEEAVGICLIYNVLIKLVAK
jgi:hypothetical protein